MYIHAQPITRRVASDIATNSVIANNTVLTIDGLNKIKTGFSMTFRGDATYLGFRE